MSSEHDFFRKQVINAEDWLGTNPYKALDFYRAAKGYAKDNDLEDDKQNRIDILKDDLLSTILDDIEATADKVREDDIHKRAYLVEIWDKMNHVEENIDEDEFSDDYHDLKTAMAEEGYRKLFNHSIGIINQEISVLDNPVVLDQEDHYSKIVGRSLEYAEASFGMTDHIGEDWPPQEPDYSEVLENLDEITATLGNNFEDAETKATFHDLAELTDLYGIFHEYVELGVRNKILFEDLSFLTRDVEDKLHHIDHSDSAAGLDDLHNLEFKINKARRHLVNSELPEPFTEPLENRLNTAESEADRLWNMEQQ